MTTIDENLLRARLRDASEAAEAIAATARELRPLKKAVGLFRRRELRDYIWLDAKAVRDGRNHVATLVGYFDGLTARSAIRDRFDTALGELRPTDSTDRLLEGIETAANFLSRELRALSERETLELAPDAPKHPGPDRTSEVARGHLMRAEYALPLHIFQALEKAGSSTKKAVAQQRANAARARLIEAGAQVR